MKLRSIVTQAICATALLFGPAAMAQRLPTHLDPARVSAIANVMAHIEQDGDKFKHSFDHALNSSTVRTERRPELKQWVHRLEDTVDDLQGEYNDKDIKGTSEKLTEALELASGINRFMLRSDFGKANADWARLRDDLNTLAGVNQQPALPVLVIRETRVVGSR